MVPSIFLSLWTLLTSTFLVFTHFFTDAVLCAKDEELGNYYQSGAHTSSGNLKDTGFNPGFQLLLPRKLPLFIISVQTSGPKIAATTTREQVRLEDDYLN